MKAGINKINGSLWLIVIITLSATMFTRCATSQQDQSQSLADMSQEEEELNIEPAPANQVATANQAQSSDQPNQNTDAQNQSVDNFYLEEQSAGGDNIANGSNQFESSNGAAINNATGDVGEADLLNNFSVNSLDSQPGALGGQQTNNQLSLNNTAGLVETPSDGSSNSSAGLAVDQQSVDQQSEVARNEEKLITDSSLAQTTPQSLGHPHGTVTWVGYNYEDDNKKIDVQIITEGSPTYRIFKEKNRAGQLELVVRYLNTKLRAKIRRDIDASEFRSPVAYIRMRHDQVFNHTDIVMTLRDEIEPTLISKGSSLMLTFSIPERWFSPVAEEFPVATAEIIEDAPEVGLVVIDDESQDGSVEAKPYIDNPGADKFGRVSPDAVKKLVPKNSTTGELIPADGKVGAQGDQNFLQHQPAIEFEESQYYVRNVAQADDFSLDTSESANMTSDLIEDLPVDFSLVDESSNQASTANQMPAPSGAQPAGSDVVGVDSATGALPQSQRKFMRLDFREAPISQIIKMISAESQINFIISPEAANKKTSLSLKNVPWDVALKAVLESNRLGMQELSNGLVRIDFLESFAKDHEAAEKARQATEALVPTKVMVMPLSYLKAAEAATMVRELLPKAEAGNAVQERSYSRFKVQAEPRSNSIVIEATPNFLSTVKTLLERLDTQTPQVRIQSRLVEFSKNNDDGLGVEWNAPFNLDAGRGLGLGALPFPNAINSNFAIDPGGASVRGGSWAIKLGSLNNVLALNLKLRAYETKKIAETLQTQDVVVQDNEQAEMAAGTTDFFTTAAGVGATGGFQEVKYELKLNVTPHITADGAVQMKLEITGDSPKDAAGTAQTSKTSRSLKTTLLKRSGETAVIGGLYSSEIKQSELGVPFLSKIPLIGALFRSKDRSNAKKDLLIMVTPTILGLNSASISGASSSSEVPTIDGNAFGYSNTQSSNPVPSTNANYNSNSDFGSTFENTTNVKTQEAGFQENQQEWQQETPIQQQNGEQTNQLENASLQSDVL